MRRTRAGGLPGSPAEPGSVAEGAPGGLSVQAWPVSRQAAVQLVTEQSASVAVTVAAAGEKMTNSTVRFEGSVHGDQKVNGSLET